MKFDFTPEEARPIALAVARHFAKQQMALRSERAAWANAPYRTTLVASKGGMSILVEAQGSLDYLRSIKDLAIWIAAQRHYAELYLATHIQAPTQAGILASLRTDGVGLLIVDDEKVALKNLEHVMKKEGYEVTATQSGANALAYLDKQPFDVVPTIGEIVQINHRGHVSTIDVGVVRSALEAKRWEIVKTIRALDLDESDGEWACVEHAQGTNPEGVSSVQFLLTWKHRGGVKPGLTVVP